MSSSLYQSCTTDRCLIDTVHECPRLLNPGNWGEELDDSSGRLRRSRRGRNGHEIVDNSHPKEQEFCCGMTSQFIACVMFAFNFIFLSSGVILLVMCIVFTTPASDVIRALLPLSHPLNIVYKSLLLTGCLICFTSLTSLFFDWCFCCFDCCFKGKNNEKSHPSKDKQKIKDSKKKTSEGNIYVKKNGSNARNGMITLEEDEDSFFLTNNTHEEGNPDTDLMLTSDFLPPATSSLIEEESSFMTSTASTTKSNKKKIKKNENKEKNGIKSNGSANNANGKKSTMKTSSPKVIKPSFQYDSSGVEVDESVLLTDGHPFQGRSSSMSKNSSSRKNTKRIVSRSCFLCFWIFMLLFLFTLQLTIAFIGFVSSADLDMTSQDENQTILFIQRLLQDWKRSDEDVDDRVVVVAVDDQTLHRQDQDMLTDKKFLASLLLSTPRRRDFDSIETTLKCCGLTDYTDYPASDPVPKSCCRSPVSLISHVNDTQFTRVSFDCGRRKHPSNIYYDGCSVKMMESMRDELVLLSSLSLGFSAVEVFGLIFSCCLYIHVLSISNSRKRIIERTAV